MIVLASKSPRRKELMKEITSDFIVFDSDIDEDISYKLPYLQAVRDIAYRKALKAREVYKDEIIISADTIVVLNNEIIHKPKDKKDAVMILKKLSNQSHEVITAYTILIGKDTLIKTVTSYVLFNDLDDETINAYVNSGSPLDKAGAYGIQDKEFNIVKSYYGSYNNIVGFPVEEIKKDLEKYHAL